MVAHALHGAFGGVTARHPKTAARCRQQMLLLQRAPELRKLLPDPSQFLHCAVRYPKAKS